MVRLIVSGLALILLAGSASAYENFIPLGTGFSTDIDSVPALGTARESLSAQSDIIETDIYRRSFEAQQRDSRFRRFFSDAESSGVDYSIDY